MCRPLRLSLIIFGLAGGRQYPAGTPAGGDISGVDSVRPSVRSSQDLSTAIVCVYLRSISLFYLIF
jgi:hypothetical protein